VIGVINALLRASNDRFLSFDTVDQDLCPLRGYCGGLQIMAQLANLR